MRCNVMVPYISCLLSLLWSTLATNARAADFYDIFVGSHYISSVLETPKYELPLRVLAEELGATVEFDGDLNAVYITPKNAKALRPAKEEWWTGNIARRGKASSNIFVGEKFVGLGYKHNNTLYVYLRDVAEALEAKVELNTWAKKISVTPKGEKPIELLPGTYQELTKGKWWPVGNVRGMWYENAALTGNLNQFSVELKIDHGLWKPSKKAILANFLITLYGSDGQIVERGTFPVYNVSSNGGLYQLDGPYVHGEVMTCVIKFVSAWTR
jgi:hypothetical protein